MDLAQIKVKSPNLRHIKNAASMMCLSVEKDIEKLYRDKKRNKSNISMDKFQACLPLEIIKEICFWVNAKTLLSLGTTSKLLYSITNLPMYWKNHVITLVCVVLFTGFKNKYFVFF